MVNESKCWSCGNAVPNLITGAGCSWSKEFKPVDGWKADRHILYKNTCREIESYHVKTCPLFRRDGEIRAWSHGRKRAEKPDMKLTTRFTCVETGVVVYGMANAARYVIESGFSKIKQKSVQTMMCCASLKKREFVKFGLHWKAEPVTIEKSRCKEKKDAIRK